MRIVAGQWRGRTIAAPAGISVRPTSDRVREAWLSILGAAIPRARVLDLCAGSGALGLEALSRGAVRVDFVENAAEPLRCLGANLATLGAGGAGVIHRADALAFIAPLREKAYDVAFADPPYAGGLATRIVEQWLRVPFASVLSVEHSATDALPLGGETRRYGSTAITFYRVAREPSAADSR